MLSTAGCEFYGQSVEAVLAIVLLVVQLVGRNGEMEVRVAVEERPDGDACLEAGKRSAEAVMRPLAEAY